MSRCDLDVGVALGHSRRLEGEVCDEKLQGLRNEQGGLGLDLPYFLVGLHDALDATQGELGRVWFGIGCHFYK